jgi:hypothetical protein
MPRHRKQFLLQILLPVLAASAGILLVVCAGSTFSPKHPYSQRKVGAHFYHPSHSAWNPGGIISCLE